MRLKCDSWEKSSIVRCKRVLGVSLLLPLMLAACGEEKVAEVPVRPVKAMVVPQPVTWRTLTYSGVIAPRIESALGFRVSGKIVGRSVNAGDRVTAGQEIARLDEKDLKLAENSAANP